MKLPKHYYSWTTFIGGLIAILSLFLIFILFLISTFFGLGDSYSGLFTFIVLPGIMISGLAIILIGKLARIRKARVVKEDTNVKFPIVDFNDPKQRSVFFIVLSGFLF